MSLNDVIDSMAKRYQKARKKFDFWKQPPADNIEARKERMNDFIDLLEDVNNKTEKSDQTKEQKAFEGVDLHALNQALLTIKTQIADYKDSNHNKMLVLKEKQEFLHKIREIALINREDELRLLTAYLDKGVRDRLELNKETGQQELLFGKATLLKYVRDKYLNLADKIIKDQNYVANSAAFKNEFTDLLTEQATVAHHKRYSLYDQGRNKAGLTFVGLFVGSIIPGIGTGIGGLLGFIADRIVSFATNWNGGASITQQRYSAMANTTFKNHGGTLGRDLHFAHKAQRVVRFAPPQAKLAAAPVMSQPVPASVEKKQADAPLVAHAGGTGAIVAAENVVIDVANQVYATGQTMYRNYEAHKAVEGYDAYRKHLANELKQTSESLAQVRPRRL